MLKQALNFTWKALINSFKPLCKQIDYQTLNRRSHPALFMNQSPRGIMRSAVPLPCVFDVVKSCSLDNMVRGLNFNYNIAFFHE